MLNFSNGEKSAICHWQILNLPDGEKSIISHWDSRVFPILVLDLAELNELD